MRVILLVMVWGVRAFAAPTTTEVIAKLPKGGAFDEVLLTSSRYSNFALLGPIGGPTKGYRVTLKLWPEGPLFELAARDGKDELGRDPLYAAIDDTKKLRVSAAPDGHAAAWTVDGKEWRALFIDAPAPFSCPHALVSPSAIPATRDVAKQILAGGGIHAVKSKLDWSGTLQDEVHRQEVAGALSYALKDAASAEVAFNFLAGLNRDTADELNLDRLFDETAGRTLAPFVAAVPERKPKLEWIAKDIYVDFWDALNGKRPAASETKPDARPPCIPAALPTTPAKTVSVAEALSRASFAREATESTCAQWKAHVAWLDAHLAELALMPRGTPPPSGKPNGFVFRTSCDNQLMAMVTSGRMGGFPMASTSSAEGDAVMESWKREVVHCGHANAPDLKCEAALEKKKQAEWLAAEEKGRRERCWPHEEKLAAFRSCLDGYATQPEDPMGIASRARTWSIFQLFLKEAEPAFCPVTKLPEFTKPLPLEGGR